MKTATLFQIVIKNPFTVFICLNVPFFMFAHIYFLYHPELNTNAIFGYKYWSVFFSSMMWPSFCFFIALLLNKLKKAYIHDIKGGFYANLIIATLYFFSIFYFAITVFPYTGSYSRIGLSPLWYYIIACLSTLSAVILIIYLPRDRYLKIIKILFKGYYEDLEEKDLINPWKKEEYIKYRVELTEEVAKHEDQ